MLAIPEINCADVAFGNIKHMPKYESVPDEFKKSYNPFAEAISSWFFNGAKGGPQGILIGDRKFTAKAGVDQTKALAAIRAVMGSWEPKHEHKTAACAFMLSEWFDLNETGANLHPDRAMQQLRAGEYLPCKTDDRDDGAD